MPQMAPVWWFSLMLFFITTFFMSMCYIYFNINSSINLSSHTAKENLIWSW